MITDIKSQYNSESQRVSSYRNEMYSDFSQLNRKLTVQNQISEKVKNDANVLDISNRSKQSNSKFAQAKR